MSGPSSARMASRRLSVTVPTVLVGAGIALTAVLCAGALGCEEMPDARSPEPVRYEASTARPRPAKAKPLDGPDWARFPDAPRDSAPLQVTHDELARALAALKKSGKNDCASEEAAAARKEAVRVALAPVLPLVVRSFGEAQRYTELTVLAPTATHALEAAALPKVDVATALLWLAAEGLDAAVCGDSDDSARWPTAILAWATSPEAIYQTAFATFGRPLVRVTSPPTVDPWASESNAVVEVTRRMLSIGAKASAPIALRGLRLTGAPGVVTVGAVVGSDAGLAGDRNGRVDPGELIDLAVEVRPSGTDRLLSESIVPRTIPPCMAVGWREIVMPEVKPGDSAIVALPRILVSGRCGPRELLELDVVSTATPARATWAVEITTMPVDLRLEPPVLDADLPGHSDEGDAALGLVGGRRLEMRPVARVTPPVEAVVSNAGFALADDAALVQIGPVASFALRPRPDGALLGDDDLDLTPVGARALQEGLEARADTNALARDPSAMWLVFDIDAELPAPPSVAGPTSSADKLAAKLKAAKTLRGRGKPGPLAAPPASRSDGNAASYLARLVPPGKSAASVRPAVVGLLRNRTEAVRSALASPTVIDPPFEPVVGAFAALASHRVLPPIIVHNVYDYLDRHRAARSRDPEARRTSRQILLVAAFLDGLPPDVAKATLERLDLMALDTANPLPVLVAALAPVALAAQLGLATPPPDGPGLQALIADLVAAADAPEAPPGPPPDSYRFRRFSRLAVAKRTSDGGK